MRFEPIPSPQPNMRVWNAQSHGYSFVISQGLGTGDPDWTGFTASWKAVKADLLPFGKQPANWIDGGPWPTFTGAEYACKQVLKQLVAKH
jgi:hypothetical protein